jgi:hypothetical protein
MYIEENIPYYLVSMFMSLFIYICMYVCMYSEYKYTSTGCKCTDIVPSDVIACIIIIHTFMYSMYIQINIIGRVSSLTVGYVLYVCARSRSTGTYLY